MQRREEEKLACANHCIAQSPNHYVAPHSGARLHWKVWHKMAAEIKVEGFHFPCLVQFGFILIWYVYNNVRETSPDWKSSSLLGSWSAKPLLHRKWAARRTSFKKKMAKWTKYHFLAWYKRSGDKKMPRKRKEKRGFYFHLIIEPSYNCKK